MKKNKNWEEIQDIETDEEDNASEENGYGSLGGGEDEEDRQEGGEATPLEEPPTRIVTLHKRKFSSKKPSTRNNMR